MTVILMMNLVLDRDQGPDPVQVPVPAPLAAAASLGAVTQEVAQTLAASQIQTQKNQRRRLSHQISQILMELRYSVVNSPIS